MYIDRLITEKLLLLAGHFPVLVLTGARQTGKSTLLQHVFGKSAETVVFDPSLDVGNARHDPELFLDSCKKPLILDEIQYAPEVVSAVKRRVDRNRIPGQFFMTGSHRWGVIKNLAESLAGRVAVIDLDGFCTKELSGTGCCGKSWLEFWLESASKDMALNFRPAKMQFGLFEQIWRGFLPEAQFIKQELIPAFHSSYRRTYIERDVRVIADVSDLQEFGRFYSITSVLSGQEINYSQFGRDIGVTPQTAHRWLNILRETCQWFEIQPFSGNAVKRISGKTKGYISDTGLACNGQAVSSPFALAGHPLYGSLFETAVAGELRKMCASMNTPPNIYHWRTSGGAEVDFILEWNAGYYPVEVKSGTRVSGYDSRGIEQFRKTCPHLKIHHGLILAPLEKPVSLSENVTAVPWNPAG